MATWKSNNGSGNQSMGNQGAGMAAAQAEYLFRCPAGSDK